MTTEFTDDLEKSRFIGLIRVEARFRVEHLRIVKHTSMLMKKIQKEGEVTDEERGEIIKGIILEEVKDTRIQKAD